MTGLSLALLFLGVPSVYYTYQEVVRGAEIRRRRTRFQGERERRRLGEGQEEKVGEKEEEERYGYDREPLEEEEMDEIKRAFGSFSVGGRWSNALGPEWREQGGECLLLLSSVHGRGSTSLTFRACAEPPLPPSLPLRLRAAWEWLFWKLIYQPLTGRVWWNGGVPSDPAELAASLPVETPNFVKLFGFVPPSSTCSNTPTATTTVSPSTSSRDLSDSWDHLSTSSATSPITPAPSQQQEQPLQVSDDLTFTWIGQSTSFVQLDGVGILTDPVFAHKTVDTFLAPPRLCPPPCLLADLLSGIQVVLLSHDHFDQYVSSFLLSCA